MEGVGTMTTEQKIIKTKVGVLELAKHRKPTRRDRRVGLQYCSNVTSANVYCCMGCRPSLIESRIAQSAIRHP